MANKVIYWKSVDDSLHPTEKEAVANDLLIIGEDKFYEQILKKINDAYGESKKFSYYEIPDKIIYRLINDDYIGMCSPLVSNPDLPYHYEIIIFKRGIKPTYRLDYIIDIKKLKL